MQPLDLETQFEDLPLSLVTLAPRANVAPKPLDLDRHFLVEASTIARRGRGRLAVIATAATPDLFLEIRDLAAQCVDRLQKLRGHLVG
jgi:hypothetical protein